MLGVLLTVPIFTALERVRDPIAAFALVFAALLIVTGYTSINAVVKAELFPAHIRALGVALPYALANTIFGGTAEYVALWFKDAGDRARLLLVRHRDDRPVADRLLTDARHQAAQPDRGGLKGTVIRPSTRSSGGVTVSSNNTCRIRPRSASFPSASALPI